jgi:ACR3 family arsenite efflux pump ArsB
MKTVLLISSIKRIAFIVIIFLIHSSRGKEIDQAAKDTVDQAVKDTVQVTVLTAQQGCDISEQCLVCNWL